MFQVNGFGKRRVKKVGDLSPMTFEKHGYWSTDVVPWLYGLTDTIGGDGVPMEKKTGPSPSGVVVPFKRGDE